MSPTHAPGFDPARFLPTVTDGMAVALTVLDLEGRILYYNDYAPKILDRKPEYIGRDVRDCHQRAESKHRIGWILAAYRSGRRDEFFWRLNREGREYSIRIAPLVEDDKVIGLIHTAMPQGQTAKME